MIRLYWGHCRSAKSWSFTHATADPAAAIVLTDIHFRPTPSARVKSFSCGWPLACRAPSTSVEPVELRSWPVRAPVSNMAELVSTMPTSTGVPALSPNRAAAARVRCPATSLASRTSGSCARFAPTAAHSSSFHPAMSGVE